jgi:hypothetical protein
MTMDLYMNSIKDLSCIDHIKEKLDKQFKYIINNLNIGGSAVYLSHKIFDTYI